MQVPCMLPRSLAGALYRCGAAHLLALQVHYTRCGAAHLLALQVHYTWCGAAHLLALEYNLVADRFRCHGLLELLEPAVDLQSQ